MNILGKVIFKYMYFWRKAFLKSTLGAHYFLVF
jgi:hypothetical protein